MKFVNIYKMRPHKINGIRTPLVGNKNATTLKCVEPGGYLFHMFMENLTDGLTPLLFLALRSILIRSVYGIV